MTTFRISTWPRHLLGCALLAISAKLLFFGRDLDWGVGWTTWIPALVLLIPASALLRRSVLRRDRHHVSIESGWLWRRVFSVRLEGELEVLPTAGLRAVILHQRGREVALATWISAATATRLLAWLDEATPLPRRAPLIPAGDR
jgi:hypothetical protein